MDTDDLLRQLAQHLEASRRRPRSVRVLDAVLGNVDRGRDHLRAWEDTGKLVHAEPGLAALAESFIMLTAVAHIETATLYAAKLVDTQPDSASVNYLLNVIEDDRRKPFLRTTWPAVELAIEAARRRLREIDAVIQHIKTKRDRELAHLDKRNVDFTMDVQAIEVEYLRQVFDTINAIGHELAQSNPAFAEVTRFSFSFGRIEDLIYFARIAFNSESVKSPDDRVEKIREFDRHLREAKACGRAPNPNVTSQRHELANSLQEPT